MSLQASLKNLLNKFSASQPALQTPGAPAASAGVKLGDLLDQAMASADAAAAYTPAAPSKWDAPAPATVKEALDRLAAAVYAIDTTPIP